MIGIYVLERKEGKIQTGYMLKEPSFSPMLTVAEEFTIDQLNPNGYIIMPTTYEVICVQLSHINDFRPSFKEHLSSP